MRAGARREFFLTGVTGFLGKVVLEELLRRREELCIERVHVLIRPSGARGSAERFADEVANSPCFARLPGGWSRHVHVVQGALEEPGLGLDAAVRAELGRRITHVLHSAASVSFDLPLARAARANVSTSLTLLDVVRSWRRLERLLYVSTAYVAPHRGDATPIAEALAPLPEPASDLYRSIVGGRGDERELLASSGHPNTYTLTKSLAEHLLVERRGEVPITVLRPSIISASWRYPFPGWIDSASGFAGFVVRIGTGDLRVVMGRPDVRLDLVPVDEVATRMLHECLSDSGSRPRLRIRHVVAGLRHTVPLAEVGDRITAFFTAHPVAGRPEIKYLGPAGPRFVLEERREERRFPPRANAPRGEPLPRTNGQLAGRLRVLNRVFSYFTSHSFAFETSHPLCEDFDPGSYVTTVCRGAWHHLLGAEDPGFREGGRGESGAVVQRLS